MLFKDMSMSGVERETVCIKPMLVGYPILGLEKEVHPLILLTSDGMLGLRACSFASKISTGLAKMRCQ